MKCIYCNNDNSKVIDSRSADNGTSIRRRRECLRCGKRFTTFERIDELPFVVIKKNGSRQPFSTEKILQGIRKSCEKRPVPIADQNTLVDKVVRELLSTVEEQEIPSRLIGEVVMKHLRGLDEVAYVRFASVYRQFKDINTFMDELKLLIGDSVEHTIPHDHAKPAAKVKTKPQPEKSIAFGDATLDESDGIGVLSFPLLSSLGCQHGFSSRIGGVSEPPFESLNMGFNRPEPRENILENYRRFCSANNLDMDSLVLASYVHGTDVRAVTSDDCSCGVTRENLPDCDGLVTDDPDVTLLTLHADCMAFYVYDPVNQAIGLAHAGWRGVLGRIGANLVDALRDNYGSIPDDLFVGIGPGICPNCFEVSADLIESFESEFGPDVIASYPDENGKGYIDLPAAALIQFTESGVPADNILRTDVCTYEAEDLYFSFRRDGKNGGKTGAMCAFMKLGEA